MTYRSSPSFAVGGIDWLDHNGEPGDAMTVPPEGGWRCFHCNGWFTTGRAALRHFGQPGTKEPATCLGPWTGGVKSI